ncbi:MAG: M20/M25/M40 family metallo-hydrolase [Candidatus Acidiferrales bacterium]
MKSILVRAALTALLLAFTGSSVARAQTQSAAPASLDWNQLNQEALGWLQDLIRMNTSNPPGNELPAAKYLSAILTKEGIPNDVYETAPGRAILIARLNAGPLPNPATALLLMGHLDVVGVDASKWTVDPFGAVIQGGYLYGRGAIDDKGMAVANVAVMVALKRSGARLNRDVILLAESDEEAGGEQGMRVAVEKYWDKIACGFSLNEEGRVIVKDGKVLYVGVQASEKVPYNVQVTATGTSGHGSLPRKDNSVVHLSAAITKIGAFETPVQLNSITHAYFEGLAAVEDDETAKWMRALETSDRQEHAAKILSDESPVWNSMLRDTIAPTMLEAGIRANVVPSQARAVLNIRLLPGNLLDPLLDQLRKLVNDPQVQLVVQGTPGQPAPSSATETPFFQTMQKAAAVDFPGASVIPMMSTGATDSAFLRVRSVQSYGLLPFPLTEQDILRMHADDERIPLDSFRKGTQFLYHVVSSFAAAQ